MRLMINGIYNTSRLHLKWFWECFWALLLLYTDKKIFLDFLEGGNVIIRDHRMYFSLQPVESSRFTMVPLNRNAEKSTILKTEKNRRLQRKVMKVVLERQYGFKPKSRELKILACYGNASWVLENLELAAGKTLKNRIEMEQLEKIRLVFPAFCDGLNIELSACALSGSKNFTPAEGKKLYPDELDRERRRLLKELQLDRQEHYGRINRLIREQGLLALNLALNSLIIKKKNISRKRYSFLNWVLGLNR